MSGTVHVNLGPVVDAVGTVNQNVLQTAEMVQAVSSQITLLSAEQLQTYQRLEELITSFSEYLDYDIRMNRVTIAKADLHEKTAEFDRQFGHYRKTRRMATGLVNALVVGT